MIRKIIKIYPFVAPVAWVWFWACLFELINPAGKWYDIPTVITMGSVLVYLLWVAVVSILKEVKKMEGN